MEPHTTTRTRSVRSTTFTAPKSGSGGYGMSACFGSFFLHKDTDLSSLSPTFDKKRSTKEASYSFGLGHARAINNGGHNKAKVTDDGGNGCTRGSVWSFGRKSGSSRRSSIGSVVEDDPSSPKVTCIGQVRARKARLSSSAITAFRGSARFKTWGHKLHFKKDIIHCFKQFSCFFTPSTSPPLKGSNKRSQCNPRHHSAHQGRSCKIWHRKSRFYEDDDDDDEIGWAHDRHEHTHQLAYENQVAFPEEVNSSRSLPPPPPPPNAFVMMRCRSDPIQVPRFQVDSEQQVKKGRSTKEGSTFEEEDSANTHNQNDLSTLLFVQCKPDLKLSLEVCKETWLPDLDMSLMQHDVRRSHKKTKSKQVDLLELAKSISKLPRWRDSPLDTLFLTRSRSEPGKLSAKVVPEITLLRRGRSLDTRKKTHSTTICVKI